MYWVPGVFYYAIKENSRGKETDMWNSTSIDANVEFSVDMDMYNGHLITGISRSM